MAPDSPAFPLPTSASSEPIPRRTVARWRWWVALLILVVNPLVGTLLSLLRGGAAELKLPKSVPGLLVFSGLEVAAFGVFFVVAWLFSRANRDEMFLRWRGWKPALWGFAYSIGMRLALMFVAMALFMIVAIVMSMLGTPPEKLAEVIKANSGGAAKVFVPAMTQSSWLYRILMLTLVSFVVAGVREELWRAATLACLRHLTPHAWSELSRNLFAVAFSSGLFGLAHLYQGVVGVIQTALLGLILGAIMLRHKSVWPAIIAHGAFDATSFLLVLSVGDKLLK
ncbi:MAG TPA: CPBP family intramembrane glutamic endopeptidase [Abditibacterium sp.]